MAALRRTDRGAELIEFAFVFPVLLLALVGIFDFGFLFQRYEVVTNAAREGARIAILPGYTTPDVQARVNNYLSASGLTGTATTTVVPVTIPTSPGGPTFNGVQVTVDYTHNYLLIGPIASFFGGSFGSVTLRAVSTMRAEVQANPGG